MRDEEIVTGIVLYATLVGEYDKRLVVLTRERGKITVFANGARRANSQFRAASQSFVMGEFTVFKTRDAYSLSKVNVKEYFSDIAKDIEKTCYASYFGELMSYYTREGDACVDNLNLLYVTFKAVVSSQIPLSLIRIVYELRLMDIEGQGLYAYECIKCKGRETLGFISASMGGILCERCAADAVGVNDLRKISKGILYTLQYIVSAPLGRLFSFTLDEEIEKELADITREFTKRYIDKSFNSLQILETL